MIQLIWPWAYILLPLPFIIRKLLPSAHNKATAALKVPFFKQLLNSTGYKPVNTKWPLYLATLIWLLMLLAFSRPQWLSDPIDIPQTGRDIMIAVDLSASMETDDFYIEDLKVDRLTAVKHVLNNFIKQREGDRIGLILFGNKAYVQTPLSFDLQAVSQMLNETETRMIGKMTAMGDAIGLAVKRLHEHPSKHRVLILLSDGNDTTGILPAERAAHFAGLEGLSVYTIGIGSKQAEGLFNKKSASNPTVLNETTLKTVAKLTNGRYFRAADFQQLQGVYKTINRLEPIDIGAKRFHKIVELYQWPLGIALLLSFIYIFLKNQTFETFAFKKNIKLDMDTRT